MLFRSHGVELFDPVYATCLESVECLGLESLQYFSIRALRQPVDVGVGDGVEADFSAEAGAVVPEDAAGELCAIVRDDAVRHTKMSHQYHDEFYGGSGWYSSHGLHFRPFGELVDANEEEAVAPERSRERAQDI